MTTRNYSSSAVATTLSSGINDSQTTITVSSAGGFPAAPFVLQIDPTGASAELVLVTAVASLTLTVTRGYDSTSALAHSTGAAVVHSHGAIDFRESRQHEAAASGVHGVTGSVVGTTDAQTLTGKTVSNASNTINGFSASQFLSSDGTGKATSSGKAVPTGAVVGTTDTQAMTNKDLSSPTNTLPTSVVTLTGTQAMTNKDLSAASNIFPVMVPIGGIVMDGGATTPTGWLECDGTAVSRTTYSALFARIGVVNGVGDGTTTFNLPNFTGKAPRGAGTPGATGGSDTVVLSSANLPPHSHTGTTAANGAHKHQLALSTLEGNSAFFVTEGGGGTNYLDDSPVAAEADHTHTFTTGNGPGTSTAVTVTNPYVGVTFIIRAL